MADYPRNLPAQEKACPEKVLLDNGCNFLCKTCLKRIWRSYCYVHHVISSHQHACMGDSGPMSPYHVSGKMVRGAE